MEAAKSPEKTPVEMMDDYLWRRIRRTHGSTKGHAWELYFAAVDAVKAETEARGLQFLSFSSYDYLGLSQDASVQAASVHAIADHGTGVLGSRIVGGERLLHRQLESSLANFVGKEAALVFVSGYVTNETLLSTLLQTKDLILYDELSHASIMAGINGSRATCMAFRHNDNAHLRSLLRTERASYRRCLIVTEGLFSMDGDIPDLPDMIALKSEYDAWLMLDESHSHGVLGNAGRGICDHFGIPTDDIDLVVGTLSKAFGSCGGFIAADRSVCEALRLLLPGFVYSVGLPPAVAASADAAVRKAIQEPHRVCRLAELTKRLKNGLQENGFDTGSSFGRGIVPVYFRNDADTIDASRYLMKHGIFAPPVVRVSVPNSRPRIRFFVTAHHTEAEIDRAVQALASSGLVPNRAKVEAI
ncbi:MAG: aminotransferase class I/II-fold pyridoxal phosphate-dependent enzyme [Pseudomonadota bacterium]